MDDLEIAPIWTNEGERMIREIDAEIARWESGDRPSTCPSLAEAILRCIVRNHFDPSAA